MLEAEYPDEMDYFSSWLYWLTLVLLVLFLVLATPALVAFICLRNRHPLRVRLPWLSLVSALAIYFRIMIYPFSMLLADSFSYQ